MGAVIFDRYGRVVSNIYLTRIGSGRYQRKMEMEEPMLMKSPGGIVDQKTSTKNQYVATICVSLGAVCAGTALAWTSPVLPQIQVPDEETPVNLTSLLNDTTALPPGDWHLENTTGVIDVVSNATSNLRFDLLTKEEASLVGAMLAIGALLAAVPAGFLADKFGRRPINMALAVPFIINWLLIVFSTGKYMLYVGRFFAGLATGAVCVTAPMYIGEIAEVSVRGTLGSFFQMNICIGIFLTYALGAAYDWVTLSWMLSVFPLIFAAALYFMPETPVYSLKTGDTEAAQTALKFLRGQEYDPRHELLTIQTNLQKAAEQVASYSDLVKSRSNRRALASALGLMMFQQMCGVNAVIFYTVPIFKSAGSGLSPDLAAILVSVVQLVVAYLAAMLIDRATRRFFLGISSTGAFVCLLVLGIYFHMSIYKITFAGIGLIPVISLMLFIVAFSFGLGPVPWMIMSELFSPEIKGLASGVSVMFNWLLVFVVTFAFPLANNSLGGHVTFYFFAIVMLFSDLFIYFYLPETKGKTIEEVQAILRNK